MERIKALINKLKEQSDQQADTSALLMTVQLLHAELSQLPTYIPKQASTAKISVVMPSVNKIATTLYDEPAADIVIENVAIEKSKPVQKNGNGSHTHPKQEETGWLFDPIRETPTLAHQKEFKEINEMIGQSGLSLNDKLKSSTTELGSMLTDAPVRDLRKAIGINDRFVFLNELFRGDETMYERSIKTINNFRILPEAEYWIERELKVKIGWDDSKEIVKHFYQLVKRRFS